MMITPQQESESVNPLARFVTEEAIALHLNIKVEQIKDIRLWRYVILVVAQGKTRFVSYADLPPIIEAEPPTTKDFLCWRKRWKKSETNKAPTFWVKFFSLKFEQAVTVAQLHTWGKLINLIKFAMQQTDIESLRSDYLQVKKRLVPV